MEPWPAESTKRSRSCQAGSFGSCLRYSVKSTAATAARPRGVAGGGGSVAVRAIFWERRGGGGPQAHRHAGVARIGSLDRVHRKCANGVGEQSRFGGHE